MADRCPRCRRVPHRHDRCPVCRAVRADLELLRRALATLRSEADASVLEAAERWERAREAALRACKRWDDGGHTLQSRVGRELEAAAEALAAAVRARRAER